MAELRAAPNCLGISLVVALAAGCGDSGGKDADAAPEIDAAPEDPTEAMFDPERLLEIEITLETASWDALRVQHYPVGDGFLGSCFDAPLDTPYTYFEADISIDGELVASVGVRKKGLLGSVNAQRPSLKISFDEYVPGQRYSGMERMTLNNNQQDPAQVNTCLAYGLFRKAGVPAPRCNWARVTVNGTYLGVYSHVESIKKAFLARHFADTGGNLYEGAMSDFRAGWIETFQKKTDTTDPLASDLVALESALESDDTELLAAVDALVDVDAFLTFWAMEVLTGHWDSYTNNANNFYLYHDPTDDRLHFIPWGPDSAFGELDAFARFDPPASLYAHAILPHRLFALPEIRARYLARLEELLEDVWDEAELLAEIDRVEALVEDHIHVYPESFAEGLARVRNYVGAKRDLIRLELDAGGPSWEHPLRSSACFVKIGDVTSTFSTTWGELMPAVPFGHGAATFELQIDGETPAWLQRACTAGPSEDGGGRRSGVAVYGLRDGTTVIAVGLMIDPELFAASATIPVDGYAVFPLLLEIDIATRQFKPIGFVMGSLQLDQASTEAGGAVSGTLTAEVAGVAHWYDE